MSANLFDLLDEDKIANLLSDLQQIMIHRLLFEFCKPPVISETKDIFDFQTESDLIIEKAIIGTIKKFFPEHNIFGEETGWGNHFDKNNQFAWVIDPIDGTRNFLHRSPAFGSSICLLYNSEPVFGIVCIPTLNRFWVTYNEKVFLNGIEIKFVMNNTPPIIMVNSVSKNLRLLGSGLVDDYNQTLLKLRHLWVNSTSPTTVCISSLLQGQSGYWISILSHYHDVAAGLLFAKNLGFEIKSLGFTETNIAYSSEISFIVSNLEDVEVKNDLDKQTFDSLRYLNTLLP